jgi:hypothetical protein
VVVVGGLRVGRWCVVVTGGGGGGMCGAVVVVTTTGFVVVVVRWVGFLVVVVGFRVGTVVGISDATLSEPVLPLWICTGVGWLPPAGDEALDVDVTVAMVASTVASTTPPPASTTVARVFERLPGGGAIGSGPVGSVTAVS